MKAGTLLIAGLLAGTIPTLSRAEEATPPSGHHEGMGHDKMPGQMVEQRVTHLSRKLNLTDAQKEQVKSILQEEADQIKPLHEQMKSIHDATRSKVNAVLTPEQQKTYEAMKEKMKSKMEDRRERWKEKKSS
jgi:Spy/CpxP family protein refolding chaperone